MALSHYSLAAPARDSEEEVADRRQVNWPLTRSVG